MVRPKKHLGQHFLTDHNIARKIVDQLSFQYPVLEVGPGKGILTRYLLEKCPGNLNLIEIDPEAVEYLLYEYPVLAETLIRGDILKADFSALFKQDFSIIGNFPYNISSQIFFRVLENKDQVKEVVCMIQKEVAQRIATGPGSKEYGILSVLLQTYYDIEYLFTVGENVFFPPPNVKSAVIRLRRNQRTALPCPDALYFTVVKTAFNQRRKTLRNALSPLLGKDPSVYGDILARRAETLSVEEFIELTMKILG
ncbi:MAG: 16S rRNA (adenine(1518)-N(6)/adenine(1519)-N(6))-dimethyltransferase RsmA [Bacteroidales bacterium]